MAYTWNCRTKYEPPLADSRLTGRVWFLSSLKLAACFRLLVIRLWRAHSEFLGQLLKDESDGCRFVALELLRYRLNSRSFSVIDPNLK